MGVQRHLVRGLSVHWGMNGGLFHAPSGSCLPPCSLSTSRGWGFSGKDGFQTVLWSPRGSRYVGLGVGRQGEASATPPQVSWRGWVCVRVAPALSHLRKPSLASVAMGPQGLWKGLQPTRGPAETGADKGVEQASEATSPSVVPAPTASSWVAPPSRGQSWHRQSGAWGACVPCTPRC